MNQQNPVTPLRPNLSVETKTTRYDRTNGALISAILLAGFLFAVMLCIWFSGAYEFRDRGEVFVPPDRPGVDPPQGLTDDILEPGVQDFPEIATPELAKTLLAVTDAISNVPATLSKRTGHAKRMGLGFGEGHKDGEPGIGPTGTPKYKRWSILFEAEDIDAYAKQLAFFKIDVAAIHRTKNNIWRVHQSDGVSKVIESNRQQENKTLRFSHKRQRLRDWDKEICRRSGVDISNVITSQFYPEATTKIMAIIESAEVKDAGRKLDEVRKTTFRIVPDGDGFLFEVVELQFH